MTRCSQHTHLHSRLTRSPSRHLSGPCHTWSSITFVTLRCHYVQCWMHSNFYKDQLYHQLQGRTIICGNKCTHMSLWMVPLMNPDVQATNPSATTTHPPLRISSTATVAANIDAMSSAAKYACYIHQIMCSPPASTLLWALDLIEELATIPGFTTTSKTI